MTRKLSDKEIKNLAMNMRKHCKKKDNCIILARVCKYKETCIKIDQVPTEYSSTKELAEALRSAGI